LTGAFFYTFVAVPSSWKVPVHDPSILKYQEWLHTLSKDDQSKLHSFEETFKQQATVFMKVSDIEVMIYWCSVGSFLGFPANSCYHATVTVPRTQLRTHAAISEYDQMKDLLILYPMESG